MRNRLSDSRVKFFLGDVRGRHGVADEVCSADFVFHVTALKQVPSYAFPDQAVKTNVLESRHVIEESTAGGFAPWSA